LVKGDVEIATFGAGSFWGVEKYFAKDFAGEFPEAIMATNVGFMH
jgi:peptide-methionine (S)-S-oxide reductase